MPLQWGRCFAAAETDRCQSRGRHCRWLQWGRCFAAAETQRRGGLGACDMKLQWGRCFAAAETSRPIAFVLRSRSFNGAAASQQRRHRAAGHQRRRRHASMGPLLRSGGDGSRCFSLAGRGLAGASRGSTRPWCSWTRRSLTWSRLRSDCRRLVPASGCRGSGGTVALARANIVTSEVVNEHLHPTRSPRTAAGPGRARPATRRPRRRAHRQGRGSR